MEQTRRDWLFQFSMRIMQHDTHTDERSDIEWLKSENAGPRNSEKSGCKQTNKQTFTNGTFAKFVIVCHIIDIKKEKKVESKL